jgi:hypothetical protein
MLIAAIPFSPFDEKTKESLRLCAKRARQYSEFRNQIAHGEPVNNLTPGTKGFDETVLAQGRKLIEPPWEAAYVTKEELRTATANFDQLSYLILGFHPAFQEQSVCDEGCLELILVLPTVPHFIANSD